MCSLTHLSHTRAHTHMHTQTHSLTHIMYSMYAITEFHIQHTDIRAATYKAFCFLPSSVNQIRFCPSCSFHTFTMLQWLSVVTLAIKQKRWSVKCRHTVKVGAVSFCVQRRQKLVFAAEVKFVKCFRVSELCCHWEALQWVAQTGQLSDLGYVF